MLKYFKSNIFFFFLLTIVVFSLYGKSIKFDFTYGDDTNLIVQKAQYLSNIKNLPTIFTTSCYYSKDFPYYRPLLNLSFMLETVVFGVNTKVYHLTNIILFILALYLMYVFMIKIKLNAIVLKFLILLVAVHPIFTSTVVWIPARNDTLLAIFIYGSLIFFINYLETKSTRNLILYLLFLALALFTKESSILIVFIYLLFIWCFNYKLKKEELIKNIIIAVPIIVIYLYFRHIAISGGNILSYLTNFSETLKNMFVGALIYLYQFIIPDIHIMLYNIKINVIHLTSFLLLLFVIFLGFYKNFIDRKVFIWCVLLFCLFLFPTCLLDDYIILNHRFVPIIPAIIIPITLFIENIIKKQIIKKVLLFLFVILFLFYLGISFTFQNNYREKNIYWSNSYIDAPNCHATAYWMGRLCFEQGDFIKAKEFFIKANNLKPIYFSDLALIYYREGNMDKAEELYNKSIEYGINKAQCYRNLSVIYLKKNKDINKAIEYAKLAIQEEPYDEGYKQYLQELQKLTNEKDNI